VDYFLTASVLVSLAAGAGVALLVASAFATSGFAFFSSFLAGVAAAGAGALAVAAGAAGALAGSAAKADTANVDTIKVAISLFMIFPLRLILN
jgi:hypothetical protein